MLVDGKLAGIGVRESVADVARVLGRQASAIVWRTDDQAGSRRWRSSPACPSSTR
jgi:ornithine carbamoyltransferase